MYLDSTLVKVEYPLKQGLKPIVCSIIGSIPIR